MGYDWVHTSQHIHLHCCKKEEDPFVEQAEEQLTRKQQERGE
jgi:hypothetical protein